MFVDHESEMLDGTFGETGESLLDKSEHMPVLAQVKEITTQKVFLSDLVVPVEIAGFAVIAGLLGKFGALIGALREYDFVPDKLDKMSSKIIRQSGLDFNSHDDTYRALLKLTDHVSGMTDSYAVGQFQLLSGIRYR